MSTFGFIALARLPLGGDRAPVGRVFSRAGLSMTDAALRLATVQSVDPKAFVLIYAEGDTQERRLDPKWFREAVQNMA